MHAVVEVDGSDTSRLRYILLHLFLFFPLLDHFLLSWTCRCNVVCDSSFLRASLPDLSNLSRYSRLRANVQRVERAMNEIPKNVREENSRLSASTSTALLQRNSLPSIPPWPERANQMAPHQHPSKKVDRLMH